MALAVGADEAFNLIDVGMLGPDAVAFKGECLGRGLEAEEIRGLHCMCCRAVLGPIFEDESIDSGTVYAGRP